MSRALLPEQMPAHPDAEDDRGGVQLLSGKESHGRRQHQAGDYPGHHQFIYLKPVKTEIKQGRSYVSFRKIFEKGTKDRPFILRERN